MDFHKLSSQLIKHEGLTTKLYTDTVGKVSIGVGHNLTDKGLTYNQVMSILSSDINDTISFLDSHIPWWVELGDVRQRVLADMTFNLMGKILDFKHMLAAIKAKDWNKAADELLASNFASQTGQRAKDLAVMLHTGMDI